MKTPDEIKQGRLCCSPESCNGDRCPYREYAPRYEGGRHTCRMLLWCDTSDYIRQLEAQNAELLKQIEELKAGKARAEASCAQMAGTIRQLRKRVNKAASWISVEERLPEGEVLAANFAPGTYGCNEYIIGYVSVVKAFEPDYAKGKCYATNDFEILNNVTHWMPLPEPPKEE